jgi:hypothetical protein
MGIGGISNIQQGISNIQGKTWSDTHGNCRRLREVWTKFPSLEIGFGCWLLDIQISRGPDTFSDRLQLSPARTHINPAKDKGYPSAGLLCERQITP